MRALFHPLNIRVVEKFPEISRGRPLFESMGWLLDQFNIRAEVIAGSFADSGPQLVIANHHGPLEGAILASLIPRDDVYIVGVQGWKRLGREMTSRLLPVYLSYSPAEHPFDRFKNNHFFPAREKVDYDEALRRNSETVTRASALLSEGATVIITPTGGTFTNRTDWKTGLGHIMKGAARMETSIVPVRVTGSRRRDALRFLNPYLFPLSRKATRVTVEVGDPVPLSRFKAPGRSAAQMSLAVRDHYLGTFGTL